MSKSSSKQLPMTATILFGSGRAAAPDSDDEDPPGAATFFTKHYQPSRDRASYDSWKARKRTDHRVEEKERAASRAKEALMIEASSTVTDLKLRNRALEQEVEQHRFLALARHREFVKMNAVEYLDKANRRSMKLWVAKGGSKKKKRPRRSAEDLYDSDELFEPDQSDAEEVMRYRPAQRPMEDSLSEGSDDDEGRFMSKPARGSKLHKQMQGMGKVDHEGASIAGAMKTIDKALKSKGKAKANADKPKRKKDPQPYNFFFRETMAQVKAEGVAPGPPSTARIAALWKEQKDKPEGIAKWEKLAADAKAKRAAEEGGVLVIAGPSSDGVDQEEEATLDP